MPVTPEEMAAWRVLKRRQLDRAVAWHRHRRAAAAQDATGVSSRGYNRLEAKLAGLMDEWGIDYRWQFRLGRYVYDFLLPGRILVEVHGTYWHADPRFCPAGALTPMQRRNILHDRDKQETALARKYRLKVIWEHDLKQGRVTRDDLLS